MSFPVSMTMSLAQKLYEKGHITYMRTDSVNLSEDALKASNAVVNSLYGEEYAKTRKYKSKSEGAQEAHEAIRPTDFTKQDLKVPANEQRLYDLIWKRAVASQMADAQLEKTVATIGVSTAEQQFVATGEVIKFEGFLKVYLESTDDDEDEGSEESKGMLPPLEVGQILELDKATATERFTRPSPRYTEASLVKKLEELGIGRPSTYAPTISTIQKRGYAVKESRDGKERNYTEIVLKDGGIGEKQLTERYGSEKGKLFPTNMGMVVNDFLVRHFPNIVDYSFTAKVEAQFDQIANGKTIWNQMLDDFYQEFHEKVEVTANADRVQAGLERALGLHPEIGKPIFVKLGRYGAYAQLGSVEDEEKPRFASLRNGQLMETLTLEEAIELFKLPREVGTFEDKEIISAVGRYGPYIKHDGKFVSLGKEHDPLEIDEDTAIELIKAKREADAKKLIQDFPEKEIKVLNGRWGPYIRFQKKNFKIPKDKDAAALTLEEIIDLIENPPAKKRKATKKKSTTSKKTTTKKNTTSKKSSKKKSS